MYINLKLYITGLQARRSYSIVVFDLFATIRPWYDMIWWW